MDSRMLKEEMRVAHSAIDKEGKEAGTESTQRAMMRAVQKRGNLANRTTGRKGWEKFWEE